MFSADDVKQSYRKTIFGVLVKLNIEMCFAVALSQTYLELLRLLAYPTSIGSHPEKRVSLYTAVYCALCRQQRACWV